MTIFALLFPGLATALWRAGRGLEPRQRPQPYPTMPGNLNATAAVAIIGGLVAALGATRTALKEARDKLAPTEAELEAFKAEDAEIEAKLTEAKEQLDAWAAEDAGETPPTDPTPEEPTDPPPPEEPAPDPAPTPDNEL